MKMIMITSKAMISVLICCMGARFLLSQPVDAFTFLGGSKVWRVPSLIQSRDNHITKPPSMPPSPPRDPRASYVDFFDEDDVVRTSMLAIFCGDNNMKEEEDRKDISSTKFKIDDDLLLCRGGNEDIIAGTKSTLQTASIYWSNSIKSLPNRLRSLMENINPFSKKEKNESDDEIDLSSMVVQNVEAPESDILSDKIVHSAGMRSGLIGSVMRSDRVKECANQLKKWYLYKGFVLHSVTGATLHAENSTATLTVYEPRSSTQPVDIRFAKVVPIDPETGETTTMRTYKTKLETRRNRPFRPEEWNKIKNELNSTLVEAKGRTNPRIISKRLGLEAGRHFKWDGQLWQNVAKSGIFARVFQANPVKLDDGSVQLQVIAQEAPPRNLEYGVQKSLYTGNWEGELDFNHQNILGGGESLGITIRRGTRDPEPSIKVQFTDDKFGMAGGYNIQLFNEYIAIDQPAKDMAKGNEEAGVKDSILEENEPSAQPIIESSTYNDDEIRSRKGFRFNFRSPISSKILNRSSASTVLERTSTRTGRHETIASGSVGVGPIVRILPLGAKTSILTSITTGTRVGGEEDSSWRLFPFSSQVTTLRQIFPIFSETVSANNDYVKLALETNCMSSTRHLPQHEANAAGLAARVRGSSSSLNGPLKASLYGSVEVRIPITIPIQKDKVNQDGKIILFGDWMFGLRKKNELNAVVHDENLSIHKSSIGLGLRKSVQGIPLKYDISLNKDGKIGASLGLGRDWSID